MKAPYRLICRSSFHRCRSWVLLTMRYQVNMLMPKQARGVLCLTLIHSLAGNEAASTRLYQTASHRQAHSHQA